MKMKKIIYGLMVMIGTQVTVHALPKFPDDVSASKKSHSVNEESDEENADAVSRWSDGNGDKKAVEKPQFVPAPIGESSFEQSASRAPASVGVSHGRSPATVEVPDLKVQAAEKVAPPRAVGRAVKQQKAYQEVAVIASEEGFFPSTIFVTQGIPVKLFVTGASQRSQCFMIDSFGVRRQIKNQKIEEIIFTPDQSGTFSFNCPMNGAKGAVVVKELEVGARIPASTTTAAAAEDAPAEKPAEHSKGHDIKAEDFGAGFNDE